MVDRSVGRQATLGSLDYSHPIFELFKQPHSGDFTAARFYRYRTLTPAATDHVLAKFDDGAAAMVERRVGSGRVIAFTSTLDDSWNVFPTKPVFVPFVQLRGALSGPLRRAGGVVHGRPDARRLGAARADRARRRGGRHRSPRRASRAASSTRRRASRRKLGEGGSPRHSPRGTGLLLGADAGHRRAPAVRRGRQPRSGGVGPDADGAQRVRQSAPPAPGGGDRDGPVARAPGVDARRTSRRSSRSGGFCCSPARWRSSAKRCCRTGCRGASAPACCRCRVTK